MSESAGRDGGGGDWMESGHLGVDGWEQEVNL